MKLISIDPGTTGGAFLWDDFTLLKVLSFAHTPEYWNVLYSWALLERPDLAVQERVGGWAGQGAKGSFTFGGADNAAYVAVSVCGVPIERMESEYWLRRLGMPHHYEIPDRDKRREASKVDQKNFMLSRYAEQLQPFAEGLIKPGSNRKSKADIWAAGCIGYAKLLDIHNIPMGQLA